MEYCKFNINQELKKAAKGKKTKVGVGLLLFLALDHYPAIQKQIADAFDISK